MLTASTQALRFIVTVAAAQGVPPPHLFAALEVSPTVVSDPDGRLPIELLLRAWRTAADLTHNPSFGLDAARIVQIADFGALGYAIRHSPSLGEAYRRFARYMGMINQAVELEMIIDGEHASLRVKPRLPIADVETMRHPAECLLGVLMECANRFSTPPAAGALTTGVAAHTVRFRHREPAQQSAHLRCFQVAPLFLQSVDELVLPRRLLEQPSPLADPLLLPILEQYLAKQEQAAPHAGADLERVRFVLKQGLQKGKPTPAHVAAQLRMSARTLQRRLQQQGTSLKLLLDEVREELARQHVQGSQIPLAEIAFMLGFSEVSAFHRAFKRWTGQTPIEMRRRRAATQYGAGA
jgi:AraC-like DNA-binding protein